MQKSCLNSWGIAGERSFLPRTPTDKEDFTAKALSTPREDGRGEKEAKEKIRIFVSLLVAFQELLIQVLSLSEWQFIC